MTAPLRWVTVIGARPQFVKAGAVSRAIAAHNAERTSRPIVEKIVHTGQHYDANMSDVFFQELELSVPAHCLDVGSGPHGAQTGAMLAGVERVLLEERPDWVLVYGDTNSTVAGALAACKLGIPVAHVEAGLRSFNRRMAEEVNRVLTDRISSRRYCPTSRAVANLAAEGMHDGVVQCGDVMYDSVLHHAARASATSDILTRCGVAAREYVLATVHRAENTDDRDRLDAIMAELADAETPVILPLHPRTRARLGDGGGSRGSLRLIDPVGYLDMLALERDARAIVSDSGGVQKEAYFFRVPCVTTRAETEWVELVEAGWNRLVDADRRRVREGIAWALDFKPPAAADGLYGDGRAAHRIVADLAVA